MYRFQIVWGLRPGPCLGKFLCVQSSESHILDVQKPPHGEWLTLPERMLFVILVEQAEGEGDHPSLSRAELGKRGNEKGSVSASQAAYWVGRCGTHTDCPHLKA